MVQFSSSVQPFSNWPHKMFKNVKKCKLLFVWFIHILAIFKRHSFLSLHFIFLIQCQIDWSDCLFCSIRAPSFIHIFSFSSSTPFSISASSAFIDIKGFFNVQAKLELLPFSIFCLFSVVLVEYLYCTLLAHSATPCYRRQCFSRNACTELIK